MMDFVKKFWDEYTDSEYIIKQTSSIVVNMVVASLLLFYTDLNEVFAGKFDIMWLKVLILVMLTGALEVMCNFTRLVVLGLRKLYNVCVK